MMGDEERRVVYGRAMKIAREIIGKSESEIFLQMRGSVPVRFVRRGEGMFGGIF